ncbi:MAG: X2-like carbohydrate binding domain-containing protein [Oscillospiraceae bacterium]
MKSVTKKIVSAALSVAMLVGLAPTAIHNNSVEASPSPHSGYVYTKGNQFMLDNNTYYYGGTNCYYLIYKSNKEVTNVLDNAKANGLNVIRTWGHLDVGKKTDEISTDNGAPVFEGNNDYNGGVASKDGVYFQYWDDDKKAPVVNEGENGIQKLDYVISEAEKRDLKLIVTFTNYWEAFGGMGQYVKYLQLKNGETPDNNKIDEKDVCEFYTNETIKQWYKDYINTLLNHTNVYTGEKLKDSKAIFSWELANEPRCTADGDGTTFCNDNILYNWAKEMSAYVKSIDSNHMVSVGDEGFYNMGYQAANNQNLPTSAYSGYYGVDFEKLMTIDDIDFGTPHMYLDQWGFKDEDASEWIRRHATTAKAADKPVILEEFGVKDRTTRDGLYTTWLDIMTGDEYEYQGFNYWMIASYMDDGNLYPDYDNYTVYGPEGTETESTRQIIVDAANKMSEKNINNTVELSSTSFERTTSSNITADLNVMLGSLEGVTMDGTELTKGTDYTVSGNTVTLLNKSLKKLELGKHTVKFLFTEGNSPFETITVTDETIVDAVLTPETVSVDKNPATLSDLKITMTLNDNEFRGIKKGTKTLTEGTEYTVSENIVTFSKDYLAKLADGTHTFVFDFYEGNDKELKITTSDSSTRIWEGSQDLGDWTNEIDLDIDKLNNWESGNLKVTYEQGTGQLQLAYFDQSGQYKQIVGYVDVNGTSHEFVLTADEYAALKAAKSATIKGKNLTVTAIDVISSSGNEEEADSSSKTDSSSSKADSSSKTESSSKADSSSKAQSSSNADSPSDSAVSGTEQLVYTNEVTTTSWSKFTLGSFNFTGYTSARFEITGSSKNINNLIINGTSYYIGATSVKANLDGSQLSWIALPKVSELQNKTTEFVLDSDASTYTIKIYGVKSSDDSSSQADSSSSKADSSSSKTDSSSSKADSSSKAESSSKADSSSSYAEGEMELGNKMIKGQKKSGSYTYRTFINVSSSILNQCTAGYIQLERYVNGELVSTQKLTKCYSQYMSGSKKVVADKGTYFLFANSITVKSTDRLVDVYTLPGYSTTRYGAILQKSSTNSSSTVDSSSSTADFSNLDTYVTASTKANYADYEGQVSNVDVNGTKLYSQNSLTKNFSRYGNLYDKSLYNNDSGSDVGIAFCGWNQYNYLQDPNLDYKLNYFKEGSTYNINRMTFIPTYFIDTYEEGIKVNGKDTLSVDEQTNILTKAIDQGTRINYRLHIDPQRFAPNGGNYSSVDTSRPGSQWWRGEFTEIHPMGDDYLAMIDQGFEVLEKTLTSETAAKLKEPIRFDIGAELMTSIKKYPDEWISLVKYCRNKLDQNELLKDNVILSYNFCHHIEYLIELEGHADYFSRINGTGITYKDRSDLLFVDDMSETNRKLLGEFIKSLDTFSISQYMPMDIFQPSELTGTDISTTPEDVRDALLTHEQNFLQKVLIGKLGLQPDEIPPFHLGEYGMGIKGLNAPNVWNRTDWTDSELATYETQQKHAEIALKGLMLYMNDERTVAKSLSLWVSGAPYDVINFYPGMNTGDSGHGYPGKAAYNENAANVLIKHWHGEDK